TRPLASLDPRLLSYKAASMASDARLAPAVDDPLLAWPQPKTYRGSGTLIEFLRLVPPEEEDTVFDFRFTLPASNRHAVRLVIDGAETVGTMSFAMSKTRYFMHRFYLEPGQTVTMRIDLPYRL